MRLVINVVLIVGCTTAPTKRPSFESPNLEVCLERIHRGWPPITEVRMIQLGGAWCPPCNAVRDDLNWLPEEQVQVFLVDLEKPVNHGLARVCGHADSNSFPINLLFDHTGQLRANLSPDRVILNHTSVNASYGVEPQASIHTYALVLTEIVSVLVREQVAARGTHAHSAPE